MSKVDHYPVLAPALTVMLNGIAAKLAYILAGVGEARKFNQAIGANNVRGGERGGEEGGKTERDERERERERREGGGSA